MQIAADVAEGKLADDAADVLSLSFGGPEDGNVGFEFNAAGHGVATMLIDALPLIGSWLRTPLVSVMEPPSPIYCRPIRTRLTCPMSLLERPI